MIIIRSLTVAVLILSLSLLFSCKGKKSETPPVATADTIQSNMPDTVMYRQIAVKMLTIDSITFAAVYSHILALDSNPLQKDTSLVSVHDSTLVLGLENGDSLLLLSTPNIDGESVIIYEYAGFIKELNSYLIINTYYEGGDYMICNRRSGTKTYLAGLPHLSPDRKMVLSINNGISGTYASSELQLFRADIDSLMPLWDVTPSWGPADVRWKDDQTVYLKAEYWERDTMDMKYLSNKLPAFK